LIDSLTSECSNYEYISEKHDLKKLMMSNIFQPPVGATVYGTLLNHREALAALGDQVHVAPYKAPPKAPILYIKPRNTWARSGDAVLVPSDAAELQMGATLGLVIARTACKVSAAEALDHVAGFVVMNDISVPHDSFYRPSMRFKCRDGSCPMGAYVTRDAVANPDALAVTVKIDGEVVQHTDTGGRVRSVAQLLVDVTEFMTLNPGDVLSIGVAAHAPLAHAGQRVTITIEGVGQLENVLLAEELV
jgi:5-oxopent-3-ene-1,2,5-tricarboxylate decarboxylase/2-hydroxyhepta-2,4-diene-1,7-dioate isomerase